MIEFDDARYEELAGWQDDYPVNPSPAATVYVPALRRWVPADTAASYGVYPKKF